MLGGSELRIEDPEERYLRKMEEEGRELARQRAVTPFPGAASPQPAPGPARRVPTPTVAARAAPRAMDEALARRPPLPVVPLAAAGVALLVLAGVAYLLWSFLLASPKIP